MNKTPRMQYGLAEVTQAMRHEIQQLLLDRFQGKEIQEAYNVTWSVITRERKRLQLGKWSPDSPSAVRARKKRVYQTPPATRRTSTLSSGVVYSSADKFPPRKTPSATVWDSIRALKPNEMVSFPCTWKHNSPVSHVYCMAFTNIRKIIVANKWQGDWNCEDKTVYVVRYE